MKPLDPIIVTHLFPEERAALLRALRSLTPEQWAAPTACEGWSVGDVARHLVADDLGRLSWQRDGNFASRFEPSSEEELRALINDQNERWVAAARRLSPRIVIDLLEWSGRETQEHFESMDPYAMGLGVSWAGESESANWFDLAREYTERWHHQAHIREGAGLPLLTEPRLFAPVIETFVRGVPHSLSETGAPQGTHIALRISGESGGEWSLVREGGAWRIVQPLAGEADASVEVGEDVVAWRLFTKGMTPDEIRGGAVLSGDTRLAEQVLQTVSIIA
jgi:uncharacterized protein (TIGR03083 family)